MSSSPKSSLVERLVQDRLRSGGLEASAAHLLQLGEGAPGSTTIQMAPDGPAALANGEAMTAAPPGATHGDTAALSPTALSPAALSPKTPAPFEPQSPNRTPFVSDFLGEPATGPAALELRPLPAPGDEAPTPPPFPLPGLAPSALVPPPATALLSSAQATAAAAAAAAPLTEPVPAQAQQAPPLAAPPIVSQTGTAQEAERPDLVQGPPTIDAVALERGGMVDWSRTRSRISEEFRLVQRQILRAAFGPGAEPGFSNLLMVTSARPGEGKSFTSVNLAGSIARQGDHHVLLVDADSSATRSATRSGSPRCAACSISSPTRSSIHRR